MASSKPDLGAFARNLVVKAFDTLASKVAESSGADAMPGLQKLADSWRGLSDPEREELASRITATAEMAAAALPVALAARKRVRKRTTGAAAQTGAQSADKAKTKQKKKDKKDKKRKKKDKKKKKKK